MATRRTMLTGGAGFIGANLARRLLQEGHELHLLVRPTSDPWRLESIRDRVCVHPVDLGDAEAVDRLVKEVGPDWVFHLAAHGAYSWQTDMRQIARANILGTVNLLEACLRSGFQAFINTGSSSEYGLKDHAPAETEWLEPNSDYAAAKASATLFCRHAARSRGVHLITLRLYSVYGPFEDPRRLAPTLIREGLQGQLPPLADPQVARDFVYADDVSEAYLLAAASPCRERGAIYNVGTGVQTTLGEAVGVAQRLLRIPAPPRWESFPNRHWDTTIWVADNHKIQEELGWRPRHTFEQGLQRMIDWYHDHPAHLNPCRTR